MARVDSEPDEDDWVDGDEEPEPADVGEEDGLSPIEGLFADQLDDVDDLLGSEPDDDDQ